MNKPKTMWPLVLVLSCALGCGRPEQPRSSAQQLTCTATPRSVGLVEEPQLGVVEAGIRRTAANLTIGEIATKKPRLTIHEMDEPELQHGSKLLQRFFIAVDQQQSLGKTYITSGTASLAQDEDDSEELRWLESALAAYNTGNPQVMESFADGNREFSSYLMAIFREYGPLTRRLRFDGAEWCQGDVTKGWVGFVIDRTADSKELTIHGIRRGINPPGSSRFVKDVEDLPTYLSDYLGESASEGYFSGCVLVARGDDILFEEAFGFADRKQGIKSTTATKFWLASLSKPFTAVAVAQLVQQGKLRFDDPIGKFIPEYPKVIGDAVTVHHLLTHTSGIEMDHDRSFMQAVAASNSIEELLQAHTEHVLSIRSYDGTSYKPLDRFDYSNEGLDLLGLIVQRISGMRWEEYSKQNVFASSEMNHTGTARITDHVRGLAKCYTTPSRDSERDISERMEVLATSRAGTAVAGPPRPAGSSYSTAKDMFRFARALTNHKIVDEAGWHALINPHVEELSLGSAKRHYGYLFQLLEQNGIRTIGHSGGASGMSTILEIYPDHGYTVVVLSNFDRSSARNVSEHIKELITSKTVRDGLLPTSRPRSELLPARG